VKHPHLVVYDYGQGGRWAYVWAESEAEISQLYPELRVVHELQRWAEDHLLPSFDVGQPKGLLAELITARGS
jgi:hypothetical protein